MKRLGAILLSIGMLLVMSFGSDTFAADVPSSAATPKLLLSDMSASTYMQVMSDYDIEIPNFGNYKDWEELTLVIIKAIEQNPTYDAFGISNPKTLQYANQVRDAVRDYYGVSSIRDITLLPQYTLQDSTVFGSWSDKYRDYNCYGYAIGKTSDFYWPGYFSGVSYNDFNLDDSIYSLALDVKADLQSQSLNQKCVRVTSTRPTLDSGETCICIRKGPLDFHFMRLSGSWCHKPGGTAILKYKYTPTTSRIWTNERSIEGVAYPSTLTYTSTIYYIIYRSNHSTTYRWTGNDYHSGSYHYYEYGDVCDCGYTTNRTWTRISCSGPPCPVPYSLFNN